MSLKDDLDEMVSNYLGGDYETYEPRGVPEPQDIAQGNKAAKLETTTLFIDVRQSSDITNAFRRQTAAKMMKSYFDGSVRIIKKNGGEVRSFNGDGMLALFVGKSRSNNAVKGAMQVRWFVHHVLQPRFRHYFENNQSADGQALEFSIGCGLDEGQIFAVKVGIRGTNDVAWVGRCTNTSAKLASETSSPREIAITRAVYKRLNDSRKYSVSKEEGNFMWSKEQMQSVGGVTRAVRTTGYWWANS